GGGGGAGGAPGRAGEAPCAGAGARVRLGGGGGDGGAVGRPADQRRRAGGPSLLPAAHDWGGGVRRGARHPGEGVAGDPLVTRHFLSSDDVTPAEQAAVIRRAVDLKKRRRERARSLEGLSVAMIFEKPSTRTRVSFEVAVGELGGRPVVLKPGEMQLGRGETIADTARILSRF